MMWFNDDKINYTKKTKRKSEEKSQIWTELFLLMHFKYVSIEPFSITNWNSIMKIYYEIKSNLN